MYIQVLIEAVKFQRQYVAYEQEKVTGCVG